MVRDASSPPSQPAPAWSAADVAALVDRFQLVPKLQRQRTMQGVLGVGVGIATVAYNLVTPPAEPLLPGWLALTAAVLFVVTGAVILRRAERQNLARLAVPAATARERATRLAEVCSRPGALWLGWATTGHVVVSLATLARLRFGWEPGTVLLVSALLPTIGLVVDWILRPPTRTRLLALN
jgi:hypothetical protein